MDRKGIIVLVVSFIALLMWPAIMKKLYPPKPIPITRPTGTNATSAATVTATNGTAATNHTAFQAAPTNQPLPAPVAPRETPPEELLVVTNGQGRYTFTSHGGGLKLVELVEYPATLSNGARGAAAAMNYASLNTSAPSPVLALAGNDAVQGDGVFDLSRQGNVVRAEKTLTNGLTFVKEFRVLTNYLVEVTIRLENHGTHPVTVPPQEWIAGTATPLGNMKNDATYMGMFWYDGAKAADIQSSWFANRTLGCFPGTPREQFTGGQNNVGWVAVHNQFFALAVVPPSNAPAAQVFAREIFLPPLRQPTNTVAAEQRSRNGRDWLLAASDFTDLGGLAFKLRSSTDALSQYLHQHLSADTRALLKAMNDPRALPAALQAGLIHDLNRVLQGPSLYAANRDHFQRLALPGKIRRLLDQSLWPEDAVGLNRLLLEQSYRQEIASSPLGYQASLIYPAVVLEPNQTHERAFLIYAGPKEYKTLSRLATRLQNNLDQIMSFGFFGWFAKMLLLSMNGLNAMGLSYGWAIIVITIIIKALFWPLTNISTRSMKRMAALQPQMKAVQEKYKDDPQKMQRKMWEFYKEHKINPAAGCLPVLVQMPIFFGFFTMIRTAVELRGARFLWIADLSQPDTLFMIPGLNAPFNLLPLIMGVTMLWQARLTPASPGADPMQQKIMKYMPLMFLVILYNFSAGLTLYWTVQNMLSIVQTKLTRTQDAKTPVAPQKPVPVAPVPRKKKQRRR